MWKPLDTHEKRILTRYFLHKANALHAKLSTMLVIGLILTMLLLINGDSICKYLSTNGFAMIFIIISSIGIIFPATCLVTETPIYKHVYATKNNQMFITECKIIDKQQYADACYITCKIGKKQKKVHITNRLYDNVNVNDKILLVTPNTTHIEPVFAFDTQFKHTKSTVNKKKRSA